MLKLLSSLIIYIVAIVGLGLGTFLIVAAKLYEKTKYITIGLIVIWVSLIFNIIYTGIFGWNFLPESDIETFLDGITFLISIIGIVILNIGLQKIKHK